MLSQWKTKSSRQDLKSGGKFRNNFITISIFFFPLFQTFFLIFTAYQTTGSNRHIFLEKKVD